MKAKFQINTTLLALVTFSMFSQNALSEESKDFQCKISSIVAQRARLKERYEIAQKKEKYAIEALGEAIASNQAENLKPNSNNPFTVGTEILIGGLTAAAAATTSIALITAPTLMFSDTAVQLIVAGANTGAVTVLGYSVNKLEDSSKPIISAGEKARSVADRNEYAITEANDRSNQYKRLEQNVQALPVEKRPELISLDQYLFQQYHYFERMENAEKILDEVIKTQKTWSLPLHTTDANKLIAENVRQAAEAKRNLIHQERELAASSRNNLNLLCEHMMKNGATTSDSSSAPLNSPSTSNSSEPKKSGGSGD